MKLFWEQQDWKINVPENGTTPLDVLEQIGKEGRAAFLEILLINYGEEADAMRKSLLTIVGSQ
jgi:hypothetical protein